MDGKAASVPASGRLSVGLLQVVAAVAVNYSYRSAFIGSIRVARREGITDASSAIAYRPLPADDPKIRLPDISRARSLLGWEPKVNPNQLN